jgi:hypothetical protein
VAVPDARRRASVAELRPASGAAHSPLASIVIVTYGNRAVTEACLCSLGRALADDLDDRFELVHVDNGSPDDTLELLASWSDRAQVLALPENRNFARGCSAGARAGRGETLIFLDNDAGGRASEVLAGAVTVGPDIDPVEPRVGVEAALATASARDARAMQVESSCGPEAVAPRILELLAAQVRNSWVTVADLDVQGEADRVHAMSGESQRRRLGVGRSGATPPIGGCTPEALVGPVVVDPEGVGC